jgi:PAS domain-containing protein
VYKLIFIILTYALVLMVNRRLIAELSLQENKFSRAFHLSPTALPLPPLPDGTIYEVNRGFERITGYDSSDIMGRSITGAESLGG